MNKPLSQNLQNTDIQNQPILINNFKNLQIYYILLTSLFDELFCMNKSKSLTNRRHFRYLSIVRAIQELGLIVIYILHFDNKFGLWFYWQVGGPVFGLSSQRVVSLFLPVQTFRGMYIACVLIDGEKRCCTFTIEHVFYFALTFIHIGMKLQGKKRWENSHSYPLLL